MNKYIMLPLVALGFLASCVEDKGNYDYTPLNEVSVENIEGTYYATQGMTEIEIDPTVVGDLYGKDLDNYEFQWHVCKSDITDEGHTHTVISTERVLKWTCNQPVGTYTIYLTVRDKLTGVEQLFSTQLRVASAFSRGFMLLGTNGSDNLTIIDMLAMPSAGDTAIVENALINDGTITDPVKIKYSGSGYNATNECMWLFGKNSSWRLNSRPEDGDPEFYVFGTFAELAIADNEYDIFNESAVDFFPDRAYSNGTNLSRSYRGYMTQKCVYGPSSIIMSEYYAMPLNRMANSPSSPLFNFYPKMFYGGHNTFYSTSTPLLLYNTDSDVLVSPVVSYSGATHCNPKSDAYNDPWRYDFRSEGRKLVWGDNTFSSWGYNVLLRKDAATNKLADICTMRIISAYSITKEKFDIDFGVAKDIDKATIFSAIGCRRAIFYAVGSVLHQYDYERNLHMEMDLGDEITMIKPDSYSRLRTNDLMVATWSSANKGTFMKFEIGNNPNNIEMAIRTTNDLPEKWSTRVKIVDVDWRNH